MTEASHRHSFAYLAGQAITLPLLCSLWIGGQSLAGCAPNTVVGELHDQGGRAGAGGEAGKGEEAGTSEEGASGAPSRCGFNYQREFAKFADASGSGSGGESNAEEGGGAGGDANPWEVTLGGKNPRITVNGEEIRLPPYQDTLGLFGRASAWEEMRCFEDEDRAAWLDEAEAYQLYRRIAEEVTEETLDDAPEHRSVVGLRGSYPGQLFYHGNEPDHFNDTLVLLWKDREGHAHVREFPVTTDPGNYPFENEDSSFLIPNRRYEEFNGWHQTYYAIHIDQVDYPVWDDANRNGHLDDRRNGWWPPLDPRDFARTGNGHNIHMAPVEGPLGEARVSHWSGGCQVIPGTRNWLEFITAAWTGLEDPIEYYLVDTRDLPEGLLEKGSRESEGGA